MIFNFKVNAKMIGGHFEFQPKALKTKSPTTSDPGHSRRQVRVGGKESEGTLDAALMK